VSATVSPTARSQVPRGRREMPAYVLADIKVDDPIAYQRYVQIVPGAIEKYGGRYPALGAGARCVDRSPSPAFLAGRSGLREQSGQRVEQKRHGACPSCHRILSHFEIHAPGAAARPRGDRREADDGPGWQAV
jgi:hypothetical protein